MQFRSCQPGRRGTPRGLSPGPLFPSPSNDKLRFPVLCLQTFQHLRGPVRQTELCWAGFGGGGTGRGGEQPGRGSLVLGADPLQVRLGEIRTSSQRRERRQDPRGPGHSQEGWRLSPSLPAGLGEGGGLGGLLPRGRWCFFTVGDEVMGLGGCLLSWRRLTFLYPNQPPFLFLTLPATGDVSSASRWRQ